MAVILAFFVCLIVIPFAHGVIPWALSTLMPRYGWQEGSPGVWNRFGVIVVAVAAALLIWILVLAIAQTPDRVKLGLTPSLLMTGGPYRFTRNPMYVAELGLWLGWSLFFGSPWVFLGFLVLLSTLTLIVLPREERGLETAFGQAYLQYKSRVPRWWGKIKH
jgi:protein-S-isoprenylcysteine O-methyltransferase Ste14